MLSANEANTKTLNSIKEYVVTELSELEEQIKKAIADGEFFVSNDGYLQRETRRILEGLGYKVETGTKCNQSYYCISWKLPER